MREVVGLFCMFVRLRGLVSKHLTYALAEHLRPIYEKTQASDVMCKRSAHSGSGFNKKERMSYVRVCACVRPSERRLHASSPHNTPNAFYLILLIHECIIQSLIHQCIIHECILFLPIMHAMRCMHVSAVTDASISAPYLAACEASWFRPGGLNSDWWAAVDIHIHGQNTTTGLWNFSARLIHRIFTARTCGNPTQNRACMHTLLELIDGSGTVLFPVHSVPLPTAKNTAYGVIGHHMWLHSAILAKSFQYTARLGPPVRHAHWRSMACTHAAAASCMPFNNSP